MLLFWHGAKTNCFWLRNVKCTILMNWWYSCMNLMRSRTKLVNPAEITETSKYEISPFNILHAVFRIPQCQIEILKNKIEPWFLYFYRFLRLEISITNKMNHLYTYSNINSFKKFREVVPSDKKNLWKSNWNQQKLKINYIFCCMEYFNIYQRKWI